MKLSKETILKVDSKQELIIALQCYASSKLWNVANYQKRNWKEEGLEHYPDEFDQNTLLKDSFWYKNLPSQVAQQTIKSLDKGWKSYFTLREKHPEMNPKAPQFRKDNFFLIYNPAHFKLMDDGTVRFTLSAQFQEHLSARYDFHDEYLFLKSPFFKNMEKIKQIVLYPPEDGTVRVRIVYEIEDIPLRTPNGKVLSIDLGIHNLMTCFNSAEDESFIAGRKLQSINHYFNRQIAHFSSISDGQQAATGVKYPKMSKKVQALWIKRRNQVDDYLHKISRAVANYCLEHDITIVVVGRITGIREGKNLGAVTNQKLHSLPYRKLVALLKYKLRLFGINLKEVNEAWTSQCSPDSQEVCGKYAHKKNRVHRGLYQDGENTWNADCVGAYNIYRKYSRSSAPHASLFHPFVLKVAV